MWELHNSLERIGFQIQKTLMSLLGLLAFSCPAVLHVLVVQSVFKSLGTRGWYWHCISSKL